MLIYTLQLPYYVQGNGVNLVFVHAWLCVLGTGLLRSERSKEWWKRKPARCMHFWTEEPLRPLLRLVPDFAEVRGAQYTNRLQVCEESSNVHTPWPSNSGTVRRHQLQTGTTASRHWFWDARWDPLRCTVVASSSGIEVRTVRERGIPEGQPYLSDPPIFIKVYSILTNSFPTGHCRPFSSSQFMSVCLKNKQTRRQVIFYSLTIRFSNTYKEEK